LRLMPLLRTCRASEDPPAMWATLASRRNFSLTIRESKYAHVWLLSAFLCRASAASVICRSRPFAALNSLLRF
jgi:hypothetical protein